jgi:hypothetical protein
MAIMKRAKARTKPGKPIPRMRKYAEDALDMLFELARAAESEAVRVSAIKEILDRGFGKSSAPIADPAHPVLTRIERVIVDSKD